MHKVHEPPQSGTPRQCARWYFDVISPFAYLALARVESLAEQVDLLYRPVLFAALLRHWDHKGPAEIETKRVWTYRWCTWLARCEGLRFAMPARHPFNPLPYLRLALAAGCTAQAVRTIFDALWTTGADPAHEGLVQDLALRLGVAHHPDALQSARSALHTLTDEALALGVFGVPTLVMDGHLFWGLDGMDLVEAYRSDPSLFEQAAMRRAGSVPLGVTRRLRHAPDDQGSSARTQRP